MRRYYALICGFVVGAGCLLGQEGNPFAVGKDNQRKVTKADVVTEIEDFTLTFEVFSVPMARVAEMKRSQMGDKSIYEELVKEVKAGKVVQDKFLEMRAMTGQSATIEQIREYIFPTEFDPPEVGTLPQKLPAGFKDFDKFITPAMPTSFDTKNLGDTVEIELKADADHPGALVGRLSYTHVTLKGEQVWGEAQSKVKMPLFEVQKINSAVKLLLGQPLFVGSLADPSDKRKGHVWVTFATVFEDRVEKR